MRKFLFVPLLMCSFLIIDEGFTQTLPNCVSSSSDSDGDGYGWENEASCIVVMSHGTCEDRGDYPWGWDPVALDSCRLDIRETVSHECIDTTPLNDGWGWDGVTSCEVATEVDLFQCESVGNFPWGWNPTTKSSCRLELAGSAEDLLSSFHSPDVASAIPGLEELLNVPLLCRKVRNDGFDDGVGLFDVLADDENVFYAGTLRYLGESLRGVYNQVVQRQYSFHEPARAALNNASMWQDLDDEPVAEFHDSGEQSSLMRQDTASMGFRRNSSGQYLLSETNYSLFGTSQGFQTSICVVR